MKLIVDCEDKTIRVGDISYGDCFYFNGYVYMLVRLQCNGLQFSKPTETQVCVNLKSGTMRLLHQTTVVSKVTAKAHIKLTKENSIYQELIKV